MLTEVSFKEIMGSLIKFKENAIFGVFTQHKNAILSFIISKSDWGSTDT